MDKLAKVRAEIERRYNEYMAKDSELAAIRADECLDILSFIDSMQEEPVSESLEDDNSFEELLQELYVKYNKEISIEKLLDIASNFAKWQRKQDKMVEKLMEKNYATGFEAHKQQMIKEAITGQLENGEDYLRIKCLYTSCRPLDDGKMVKLIIIKEEGYGKEE